MKRLLQKAIEGGAWILSFFIITKVLYFVINIILARLLSPSDFGLMGIALFAFGAANVFTETGLAPALIQRKHVDKNVLDTAWIMSICRGMLLVVLIYIVSPAVAFIYNTPKLEILLKIMVISIIFSSFRNIGIVLLDKEFDFKKKAMFNILVDTSNMLFSVVFAFIMRSVWALVIGHIIGSIVSLVYSYVVHSFRPAFRFDVNIAKQLFKFGKYIFGAGVFMFLVTQGDNAVAGKMLGMVALGYYTVAYKLATLPVTAISYLISQISVPVYSKIQDSEKKLGEVYLKVLRWTSFFSAPLSAGLFVLAPEIVRVFYGQKWMPIIPVLYILCFLGFFRSIVATVGPVFISTGRPEIVHRIKLYEFIFMAIIIYPLIKKYGIMGVGLTVTLVYLLSLLLNYVNLKRILSTVIPEAIRSISMSTITAMIMGVAVYFMKKYIFLNIGLLQLLTLTMIGVIIYFILNFVLDRRLRTVVN